LKVKLTEHVSDTAIISEKNDISSTVMGHYKEVNYLNVYKIALKMINYK
jgi:hypothetical protein